MFCSYPDCYQFPKYGTNKPTRCFFHKKSYDIPHYRIKSCFKIKN